MYDREVADLEAAETPEEVGAKVAEARTATADRRGPSSGGLDLGPVDVGVGETSLPRAGEGRERYERGRRAVRKATAGPSEAHVESLKALRQRLAAVDPRWLAWATYLPLAVLVIAYTVHFSDVTVAMLRSFQQPAYDMAMPDQGIWLLSRFHDPFLTVAGRNLFGDHPSFVYLLLVPVYWVYPHTSALLVARPRCRRREPSLSSSWHDICSEVLRWPPFWPRPTCSALSSSRRTSNSSMWRRSKLP